MKQEKTGMVKNDFYTLEATKVNAKAGLIKTDHGTVKTPVFMPVGTTGTVKAVGVDDLENIGAEILLGNTYHLYLRPGNNLVKRMGGLHNFMRWKKPILTDSGGFQVSSLGWFWQDKGKNINVKQTKIDEEGVTFWSHLDGSEHRINAEKSIQIQYDLGADIIMAFDEATPDRGEKYAKEALARTHKWLLRSIKKWSELEITRETGQDENRRHLFGIIQGGDYQRWRKQSAEFVVGQSLNGIAVGGGSIGKNWEQTEENVSWIRGFLPKDKPLYLMGVGSNPMEVVGAVMSGADMFDCVAPTRLARTGYLYNGRYLPGRKGTIHPDRFESQFPKSRLNISLERFKKDEKVIDPFCDCLTCQYGYTRAYLRHLYLCRELLYYRLASVHNLRFMVKLCQELRGIINKGNETDDADNQMTKKSETKGS